MTVKRRNLDNTRALHIALTVAANELEQHLGGEQVDQLVVQGCGAQRDLHSSPRDAKPLSAE